MICNASIKNYMKNSEIMNIVVYMMNETNNVACIMNATSCVITQLIISLVFNYFHYK